MISPNRMEFRITHEFARASELDDLPQVFRGYYGKEEARCPVAADHVLWCQAVLPCLLLPFISSIWICIWYVLMAIVLAKIGTVFCLVQPHCRRVVGKAAGCNQAVVLWWEHDWVDRPGNSVLGKRNRFQWRNAVDTSKAVVLRDVLR